MTVAAACALSDTEDATADPIQLLAHLAACAMRMARRAVEQYEALTSPAENPESASTRKQPDPGTLFTRAARIVLDCITKESRLLAGLPLAPARPRATPLARNEFPADSVRQTRRTGTDNHPPGEELPRAGLEHLDSALAAPEQATAIPDLLRNVCAAAGIPLNRALRRRLARDPAFAPLAAKPPAPD